MDVGLGIVIIGRNEGERLKACIRSLPADRPRVYVDSGSTDGSPDWARSQGCEVIELSTDRPFSAARARNEGFELLVTHWPDTEYVQFIDGDCELLEGWINAALDRLGGDDRLAVVAGLRKERYPEKSWYNQLCAYEWDTPIGLAAAVGGDAVYRVSAFQQVGGFDPLMMAGEEPELCLRLREAGFLIERLDQHMTLHDAAIYTFGAWWKRAVRSGYASTLGLMKHGRKGYRVREVARAILWGGVIPALILLSPFAGMAWLSGALILLLGVKWLRLRATHKNRTSAPGRYAFFIMLTNMAEVFGITYSLRGLLSGSRKVLEYKGQ